MGKKSSSLARKATLWLSLLLIAAAVLFALNINLAVKKAIETAGTGVLGSPVTVDGVLVSPLSKSIRIQGLVIGNPEGFSEEPALSVKDIRVTAETLLDNPAIISLIAVNGIDVRLEAGKSGTNLSALRKKAGSGSQSTADKSQKSEDSASERKLIIRELTVDDISVTPAIAAGPLKAGQKISVASLRLSNLGSEEKPLTAQQAAQKISAVLLGGITEGIAGAQISGGKEKILEGLGGIGKGAVNVGSGVVDGVKGVFSR